MDLATFARRCSSLGGQRQALLALEDDAVRSLITSAGAVSFGAAPLGLIEGRIVLATVPDAHPSCERALGMALGAEVKTLPFDDGLVRGAIAHHYLRGRDDAKPLDLQTFDHPDFLDDESAASRLLEEKPPVVHEETIDIAPERIALLDLRMHSFMRSLDRGQGVEFVATPSALGFRLTGDGAMLLRDSRPPSKVRAIVSQAVFYDGDEHIHAMVSRDLDKLPHVIHPSEMQLVGLSERAASFWVYDSRREVTPGERASWDIRYWFLQFGGRMERRLRLDVLAFVTVARDSLAISARTANLLPPDLERLFGLDFARIGRP